MVDGSHEATKARSEDVLSLLVRAAHCQGGHSNEGRAIADQLNIPFPLTMANLENCAARCGFDSFEVWPWLKRLRAFVRSPSAAFGSCELQK